MGYLLGGVIGILLWSLGFELFVDLATSWVTKIKLCFWDGYRLTVGIGLATLVLAIVFGLFFTSALNGTHSLWVWHLRPFRNWLGRFLRFHSHLERKRNRAVPGFCSGLGLLRLVFGFSGIHGSPSLHLAPKPRLKYALHWAELRRPNGAFADLQLK